MSKDRDEKFQQARDKLLVALEADDLSAEARGALIEKFYSLPKNLDGLKSDLYYDLLDKYMELRQTHKLTCHLLSEEMNKTKKLKTLLAHSKLNA